MRNYNQQPTILIGLGGLGGRIADEVYGKAREKGFDVSAFVIDSDDYDLLKEGNIPKENKIDFAIRRPVKHILATVPEAREWFPNNPLILGKTLAEGAGQVRAVLRLMYDVALRNGAFGPLFEEVDQVAEMCRETGEKMRISIVTSLTGGTGAGIFLQVAMLLRDHLINAYPEVNVRIHGEFILPAHFNFIPAMVERKNIQALAYASMKELHAINEQFFSNGPAVELNYTTRVEEKYANCLPYDYCFLYDEPSDGNRLDVSYVIKGIWKRLFDESANATYERFVQILRSQGKKQAGNMYGIVNKNGDVNFGVELSEQEQFRYETGQYYQSYQEIISRLPHAITPHLNANWHVLLPDLGYQEKTIEQHDIPKEAFVFISYSSKDTAIAEQTRYVLTNNGISCWMAPQSIPAGSDYGAEIPKAIANCGALVLLLSKSSQASSWVPKEVGSAISKGKIVIPFHVDDSDMSETFDFMLTNNQRIAAYNRMSEAYRELVRRLTDILK